MHTTHQPKSHVNEVHHVWPLGDGGPNIAANRVVACATGHNNIHALVDAYRRAGGDPGWETRRRYARLERHYAAVGWDRIQRKAM